MTVCIAVNGKKFQSQTVTLTLIGQCPMSNSSEDFSYCTVYSNFKILDHLFFELSCLHTDRQTDTKTDRQTDRQRRQVLYTCGLNRKYNKLCTNIYNKVKNIMSSNHNVTLLGSTTTQSPIIISNHRVDWKPSKRTTN